MCAPRKNCARSDEEGCEPENGMMRLLDSKHSIRPVIAKLSSRDQVYAQTDDHSNNQFQMINATVSQNLWRHSVALQQ